MLAFVGVIHIIVALLLVALVLVQDSKGGAMGGVFGGGGSGSLLGATGGANLLVKITRYTALFFAGTCITLTIMSGQKKGSVVEGFVPTGPAQVGPAPSKEATPDKKSAGKSTEKSTDKASSKTQPDSGPSK